MNSYEIWTVSEYGLFEESVFSPLVLVTEIMEKRVAARPVFFGDSLAGEDDINIILETGPYRNLWVAPETIVVASDSCLKKVAELSDKEAAEFIRTVGGENLLERGRPVIGENDPLESLKIERQKFFNKYSDVSLSREFSFLPEFIKNRLGSILRFDSAELVMQQAAGGNRTESRIVDRNSMEINYSLERRIDQDGDLVISINGRADIKTYGKFHLWLVLAKDDKELFRKEIDAGSGHFEEYYYKDELKEHSLDPENVMAQLEKGDLKCYLIIDCEIEE